MLYDYMSRVWQHLLLATSPPGEVSYVPHIVTQSGAIMICFLWCLRSFNAWFCNGFWQWLNTNSLFSVYQLRAIPMPSWSEIQISQTVNLELEKRQRLMVCLHLGFWSHYPPVFLICGLVGFRCSISCSVLVTVVSFQSNNFWVKLWRKLIYNNLPKFPRAGRDI